MSGSNSKGIAIAWMWRKSHSRRPSQRTCLAMRWDVSYISPAAAAVSRLFSGSPNNTPLAESVCEMACVRERPRPVMVVSNGGPTSASASHA